MNREELLKSAEFQTSVKQIVSSVTNTNRSLEGVCPPDSSLTDSYQKDLDVVGAFRGRPLFFKYLSSGMGRGPYVKLKDGSVKLDLINGIGVQILGHSHEGMMNAAVIAATSDVINQGHLQCGDEYRDLGSKLVAMAKGSKLEHCWLSTCGTMANENALKISRQKNSPARYVLALNNAFSGRSTMMAEITDNKAYKQGLPEYDEVIRIPFYDKHNAKRSQEVALIELRRHIAEHKNDISVFCFEPVLGEGGYRVAPLEYYKPLLEECRANNIAIWADEVQTFLRTGEPYAFQTLGFSEYVDICSIAKTAQIGATLYTNEYNPKPGLIAGTFAGTTVALSVGNYILDFLEQGSYFGKDGRISEIHNIFVNELQKICDNECKGLLEDPDGLGLMVAVTPLGGKKDKVMKLIKKLFDNGLICFGCGKDPFRLRFLVPAIITDQQIKEAVEILKNTLLEFEEA